MKDCEVLFKERNHSGFDSFRDAFLKKILILALEYQFEFRTEYWGYTNFAHSKFVKYSTF